MYNKSLGFPEPGLPWSAESHVHKTVKICKVIQRYTILLGMHTLLPLTVHPFPAKEYALVVQFSLTTSPKENTGYTSIIILSYERKYKKVARVQAKHGVSLANGKQFS